MKTLRNLVASLLTVAAVLVALPVAAQTTVTQTTSASAQTAGSSSLVVSSATGIAVGARVFLDREEELVTAVSGTTLTVIRGQEGTNAVAHASGSIVWVDPTPIGASVYPGPFVYSDPPLGSCTLTAEVYSVRVNVLNGVVWACQNSKWAALRAAGQPAQAHAQSVGAAVASATTITPTGGIFHVTGTTAIATINVPAGCDPGCQITLIPDALGSTTNAGNISLGSTFVVNKALVLTWDGTKWNPSY